MNKNNTNFRLVTLQERPDMHQKFWSQAENVWPEFMLHNKQAIEAGVYLISVFKEFQVYLVDKNTDEPVAFGQTIPCYWDGTISDLPMGWMSAIKRGIAGNKQLLSPNTLVALQISVLTKYQRKGLSHQVISAMKEVAIKYNFHAIIVPVRPLLKPQYPLMSMEEFIDWRDDDNQPFDPWLKLHWRCGAEILKIASQSFEIRGTIKEWEKWTGLHFPTSGDYIIPGALTPIQIDRQSNIGIYIEPNVWMHHPIKLPYLGQNKPSIPVVKPYQGNKSQVQYAKPVNQSKTYDDSTNNLLVLSKLFTSQVDRNPDKIAVIYQTAQLTYKELNQQANQLAHHLQQQEVKPEQLVGLSISPSLEMVVAIWGILKAGGAFVPLDPTYPADRLKMMIQDSQIDLIVTTTRETNHLVSQPAQLIYLDELPTGIPSANLEVPNPYHLACCLYTSGSTGQPKGVLIEHQALANHCLAMQAVYEYTANDRGLLFASLNYVAALEQLFMPLLNGASLTIREPELWNATTFPAKIREYGITVVDLSPGYWHALLESWQNTPALIEDLPLRLVILGGDETRPETVKLWQQTPLCSTTRFLNAYGMTETPVTATLFEIPADSDFERVPIGRPAHKNWQVYLLDDQLQLVSEGKVGEICIGGASLARGYLNQPTLTAEKFVDNPIGEGRLYRTGDLGRFLPDGNLEYLGRKDYQVQIRGFRVELGEIEAALLAHPAVKEAAVMNQGEGANKQLVAYAVCHLEKSIWQVQGSYRHEEGILTDPTERMAFKLQQVNIQSFTGTEITLTKPLVDEAFIQTYLARQSYRQFVPKMIPFEPFCQFLSCLLQLKLPEIPLPKYRYPSALGLYPVQTYLQVKNNRIEGISEGFYYYHPITHRLVKLKEEINLSDDVYGGYNQSITHQAAFSLFLVAHLEAIRPLYGQQLAEKFCLFEAGYMGQLLMTEAPTHQIGLCPLGDLAEFEKSDEVNQALGLTETQWVVHSFLGGAIEPAQTKTWLQPTTNQLSPADLKADLQSYLKEKLPPHMVPEQLILREQLPRTPNGKVDRQALANITIETDTSKPYIAPRTPMEQSVVQIWQELLKVEPVGVTDEFFALGGNSLLALQLLSKIEQQFQVTLPLQTLLSHNTVEQLAQQLDTLQSLETMSSDMNQEDYDIEGIL